MHYIEHTHPNILSDELDHKSVSEAYPWGSAQYNEAASVFHAAQRYHLTPEQMARVMGGELTVKLKPKKDWDRIFSRFIAKDKADCAKGEKRFYQYRLRRGDWKAVPKNGDDFLKWARKNGWDLWTAVPELAKLTMSYQMKEIYKPMGGPHLLPTAMSPNAKAWASNYGVGLLAHMMVHYGIVKDERSFKDFDT